MTKAAKPLLLGLAALHVSIAILGFILSPRAGLLAFCAGLISYARYFFMSGFAKGLTLDFAKELLAQRSESFFPSTNVHQAHPRADSNLGFHLVSWLLFVIVLLLLVIAARLYFPGELPLVLAQAFAGPAFILVFSMIKGLRGLQFSSMGKAQ